MSFIAHDKQRGDPINAKETALFVVDMQPIELKREHFADTEQPDRVIRNVNALLGYVRKSTKMHIVHVLSFPYSDVLPTIQYKGKWPKGYSYRECGDPTASKRDPDEFGLHPALNIESGDWITTKSELDAFSNTCLISFLSKQKICNVITTGVQTHECVLGTARGVRENFRRSIVLSDCTAAVNVKVKEDALDTMSREGIHVLMAEEMKELLI